MNIWEGDFIYRYAWNNGTRVDSTEHLYLFFMWYSARNIRTKCPGVNWRKLCLMIKTNFEFYKIAFILQLFYTKQEV